MPKGIGNVLVTVAGIGQGLLLQGKMLTTMAALDIPQRVTHQQALSEFEAIYQQYHKAVYGNIYKVVKEPERVEDVFQDVFLTLWEHLVNKPAKQSLASWLFVVSHNKAKACLRKEVERSLLLVADYAAYENDITDTITSQPVIDAQMMVIQKAVQNLSPRRRQVFTLHKFEGRSVEEIAETMSTTPGTVKEYLKQSVRMVRDQVMNEGGYAQGAVLMLWMLEQHM